MADGKNVVPLRSGGAIGAIIPQTIEEVFRLAKAVAASGLAPESMKTPEQITVAIMHGLEIGLPPMQAIQRIAVINGRPAVWGDAVPAILWSNGFKIREGFEGNGDDRLAWCEVTRPDGEIIRRTFSVADAKRAGLWQEGKHKVRRKDKRGQWYEKDNDSSWYRYPERMLRMRARGYAARDGAADALSGLCIAEEAQDIDAPRVMRDVTHSHDLLEPPDIDEESEQEAADGESTQDENGHENGRLIDEDAFLKAFEDELATATDSVIIDEIIEVNAEQLDLLDGEARERANALIDKAREAVNE